jgi:hypothetical protein
MTRDRHIPVMDLEEDWDEIRAGAHSEDETYVGERDAQGQPVVYAQLYGVRRLLPVTDIGFDWGCDSAGTRYLALAILMDAYGEGAARKLYALFADMIVCRLPDKSWTLTRGKIDEMLEMFL